MVNQKTLEDKPVKQEKVEPGLEQKFIAEFLREKGLTLQDLKKLPADEARKLRIEASKFATARLAELEARARFIHTIHDATST